MTYDEFRIAWFSKLTEDVRREIKGYLGLDIEAELEAMCKYEFENSCVL